MRKFYLKAFLQKPQDIVKCVHCECKNIRIIDYKLDMKLEYGERKYHYTFKLYCNDCKKPFEFNIITNDNHDIQVIEKLIWRDGE